MSLRDLVFLAPGDAIVTEKEATEPVVLCVEGEKKFIGKVGQFKGQLAPTSHPRNPTRRQGLGPHVEAPKGLILRGIRRRTTPPTTAAQPTGCVGPFSQGKT